MKAVILCRVSTADQEAGHSIDAQRDRLIEYCARKGLTVDKTYIITESSTRGERRRFNEIITYIKSCRTTIALVADSVDRVQRSFKESVALDELRRKETIELHFYREGMVIGKQASASDLMRWDFLVLGAKSYVMQLSENVRRSLDHKVKNGQWYGPAPVGYLNTRDMAGKATLIVDQERGMLIKRLFLAYATGEASLASLTRQAELWGLKTKAGKPMSKSQVHAILCSPFYAGIMTIKNQRLPHKYERLVDEALFDRCQQVRQRGMGRKPGAADKKPFIFRGCFTDALTGNTITCDVKKGAYTYLVATNPADHAKKLYVPEETVLKQIQKVFDRLHIPDDVLAEVNQYLKDSVEAEKRFYRDTVTRAQREEKNITGKMDGLLDLLLEAKITQQVYDAKVKQLEIKRQEALRMIDAHVKADTSYRETIMALFCLANQAGEYFSSSNFDEKRQFMKIVFSNLKLNGASVEYSLRKPFDIFAKNTHRPEWRGIVDALRTQHADSVLLFMNLPVRQFIPPRWRL